MMAFAAEKMIALAAVREAAAVCERVRLASTGRAMEKQDRSPVTVADFASQALVCSRLRSAYPEDPIIAEETSAALREEAGSTTRDQVVAYVRSLRPDATEGRILSWIDYGDRKEHADRYWTLDPVDGTKGFIRGDQYVVALALIEHGDVVVAAVACPNLVLTDWSTERGMIAIAARGEGADLYGLSQANYLGQATVSLEDNPVNMRFCESVESAHSAHDESHRIALQTGISGVPVRMDSQAKYVMVAAGAAEIYMRLPTDALYVENIWDHAAGCLLVEEAGGRVTDTEGKSLDFRHGYQLTQNRGIVASHGPAHEAVLSAITA